MSDLTKRQKTLPMHGKDASGVLYHAIRMFYQSWCESQLASMLFPKGVSTDSG